MISKIVESKKENHLHFVGGFLFLTYKLAIAIEISIYLKNDISPLLIINILKLLLHNCNMETSNEPKKHHFVPECYLKAFSTDGFLFRLDVNLTDKVKKSVIKELNISAVCYKVYMYKIESKIYDSERMIRKVGGSLGIETKVNAFWEMKYNTMLAILLSQGRLTSRQCIDFSKLIIHLKSRTLFYLNNIIEANKDKWLEKVRIELLEESEPIKEFTVTPDGLKVHDLINKMMNEAMIDEHFGKTIFLDGIINRSFDSIDASYLPHIVDCGWTLLVAGGHSEFVTSDNPGFTYEHKTGGVQNTKFIGSFTFYFPIAPKFCLAISDTLPRSMYWAPNGDKIILKKNVDDLTVKRINFYAMQLTNGIVLARTERPLMFLADCILNS